jgi:hypothetical protein
MGKPIIRPAEGLKQRLLSEVEARMKAENEERLKAIHVSDLVYCLKKAYWRRQGYEEAYSEKDLTVRGLGKGHHNFLETLRGAVREAEVERHGVIGHIDMLEDHPIEIKTTRQTIESKNIPEHYLRQLAYYCILTSSDKGFLIVFNVISGRLQVFEANYSGCLGEYEAEFRDRLGRLRAALEANDPSLLEGSNFDWECHHCGFRRPCERQQPKAASLLTFVGAEHHA